MPREFGINSYMTQLIGKGHQAPEWEMLPPEKRIKAIRLASSVDTLERATGRQATAKKIKELAQGHQLELSEGETELFMKTRQDRRVLKGIKLGLPLPEPEPPEEPKPKPKRGVK